MPGPYLHPPPPHVQGIPTKEELDEIPRLYSWERLKEIVASGELGDLKRHPILAEKYGPWCVALAEKYGSTERYLVEHRLPWKTPPSRYGHSTPCLTHGVDPPYPTPPSSSVSIASSKPSRSSTPKVSFGPPVDVIPIEDLSEDYLTFEERDEFDEENYAALPNDWPYNVPKGVEHCIVWSKHPIFHPSLINSSPSKWAKISQEGFAGWTGTANDGEKDWFTEGGGNVDRMVRALWRVEEFECAWFVNPPRLQSVRGLSHFHVFARLKTDEEKTAEAKAKEQVTS